MVAPLRVLVLTCLLAAIAVATAQPPAKVYRVGVLAGAAMQSMWRTQPQYEAFLDGLRQHGYVEGQNVAIEFRTAEGKYERLPDLAAELVGLNVDVLFVVTCGAPLDAARRATRTTPIVVGACTDDMVAAGIVKSLARPEGNITGLQKLNPELSAKRLELLKAAVPNASRVAVLWDPGYSDFAADWGALRTAADALGVTVQPVEVHGPAEYETAFATMVARRVDALLTFSDAMTYVHGRQLVRLAADNRLPAIYAYQEITSAGGFLSYGPSIPDMFRHATVFVDKILHGARPGDLPIEQPTHFELVVNLRTARALGITIPQSILMRADKVIE
ncbi:MAG: ABC transporter substrate-binding protein [Burkholderiales bacterium]|nr:ABC transporter substrate-binding protein [Burkholderiales bacterium]